MSWISLGWLGIEGGIAILAAVLAGWVALLGFGIDTAIEALVSIIVVWRFSGERTLSTTAEASAQKAVAVSFFLLASYIAAESVRTLVVERHAETTWLGVILAAVSLVWCPVLGVMKKRLGRSTQLGHHRGRSPAPAMRLSRRRRAGWASREHPVGYLVA
jgi:hypothetical protein